MAKSRLGAKARSSARKPARSAKKRSSSTGRTRPARGKPAKRSSRPARPKVPLKTPVKAVKPVVPQAPPPAPAPARKPTYHEAVAMYERGLQALQRRDFAASADALRLVIERYPDERELLERARLYLKVCERELEPKEPSPKTADEWVYAATVSLNSGDDAGALRHLQRAVAEDSRHDHAHYMIAVASARRNDRAAALDHLRRAVALNPENRSIARQDPELDSLREDPAFRAALEAAPLAPAAKPAAAPRKPRR